MTKFHLNKNLNKYLKKKKKSESFSKTPRGKNYCERVFISSAYQTASLLLVGDVQRRQHKYDVMIKCGYINRLPLPEPLVSTPVTLSIWSRACVGMKRGGRAVHRKVFKGKSLQFAVGTRQSYLHPPFLAVRRSTTFLLCERLKAFAFVSALVQM